MIENLNFEGGNDTKVCQLFGSMCCQLARGNLTSQLTMKKTCDCLPDCTSIDYDMEYSQYQNKGFKTYGYDESG